MRREDFLQGDNGSIETALNGALRRLEKAAPEAAGQLDDAISAIDRALIEAGEARIAVSACSGQRITNNPARLEEVEGRLFALRGLARKHNVDLRWFAEFTGRNSMSSTKRH